MHAIRVWSCLRLEGSLVETEAADCDDKTETVSDVTTNLICAFAILAMFKKLSAIIDHEIRMPRGPHYTIIMKPPL